VAEDELPGLGAMLEELRTAPEIVRPSGFWEHHAELQYRELEEHGGFAAFKRTVNRHFFQFTVTSPRDPQFQAVIRDWARHPSTRLLRSRLEEPLDVPAGRLTGLRSFVFGRVYAAYVAALAGYARRREGGRVFDALEEPALGRPLCVSYGGRRISEDLCNSAIEYASICEAIPRSPSLAIELGSGYGRLAWVFLRAFQNIRYVLVDIPPGLAIAQRYLTELFPERRAFRFRHIEAYADVADEFESAELIFLTPNQLELIPPLHADLFINVSSLHEMRPAQIGYYFEQIARHCDGWFYTKQWVRSINQFDDLIVRREDYPVPSRWTAVFDRVHPVQTHFFEALYDTGADF
jgi:putative sugar O-methyltransferase